jgi:CHAD domain-containing protein
MKPEDIASRLASFLPSELRRTQRALKGAGRRNPDVRVHEARKSTKKLRAALRLARKMASKRVLDGVGHPLRKAAHALGPLHDHLVLNKTGRDLAKRGENMPPLPDAPDTAPLLKRARAELRRAAGGLRRLLQGGFDEEGAEAGLRRIYKRARKEMTKACKSKSDEDLHAWRRRAKDLYYILDLVEAPSGYVEKMRRLTELLGDDHDLACFGQAHGSTAARKTHHYILKRARKRRRPLQKEAFRLGRRLFDRDERDFARRVLA